MPKPGSIGVVKVTGDVGKWIRFGEWLLDGHETYQHAFVVLDDGTLIEAQPGGAVIHPLSEWPNARYNDNMPLTDAQRAAIVKNARELWGTPYGWLDYASLVLMKFHIRPAFVVKRVNNPGHLICSQLADLAYQRAGVELFEGRHAGDVTPGDLGQLFDNKGW